ncbi:MMPL family protein, partial [Frankia sp. EI5c]|uniref:MMPL family transporter n=1 Tax=Frankia sp. EI5c TaxID=683316 RepID=UPI0007C292A1
MVRPRHAASGRLFPWLVVLVWLAAGVAISPLAFRLTDAQTNDAAAFLPEEAESTRVLEAQEALPGGDSVPAVVVLARDTGLTQNDLVIADDLRTELAPFSATPIPAVLPSTDQQAALITIPMPQTKDVERFTGDVEEIRDIAHRAAAAEPGLQTALTGPAGRLADTYT